MKKQKKIKIKEKLLNEILTGELDDFIEWFEKQERQIWEVEKYIEDMLSDIYNEICLK